MAAATSRGCGCECVAGIQAAEAYIAGSGKAPLQDRVVADGAIEFSLPKMGAYAVVDLR